MAATVVKTLVSEQDYLQTHFGDRTPDYVDGEIVERTLPNSIHSQVQAELVFWFRQNRDVHGFHARPEIRLRVAEARYRIVDLAVFWPNEPTALIPAEAPLVVVEIVSPDDAWTDIYAKLREYHAMGVEHVWLVDPESRSLVTYGRNGLSDVRFFELPQFGLRLTIDELLPAQ